MLPGLLFSAGSSVFANLLVPTYSGAQQVAAFLIGHALKLAEHAHKADEQAAAAMVDLMKQRVPQDTGRLLNGIGWSWDGDIIEVRASAHRTSSRTGKEQEDYARFVEFGTKAGQRGGSVSYQSQVGAGTPADVNYFIGEPGSPHPRTRKVYRNHPGTPAQPFFFNSAREVMAKRGIDADRVFAESGQDAGWSADDFAPTIDADYTVIS